MRSDSEMLELVRARAARIKSRRRAALVGAVGAVAFLGIGGAVLAQLGGPSDEKLKVVSPTPTTDTTTSVSGESEPAPTTSTTPPSTSPTSASTTTTVPPPNLVVQVSVAPAPVKTAEIVTVTVHYADGDGAGRTVALDYGDGTSEQIPVMATSCAAGPAPRQGPHQGDERFSHSYRRVGTYAIKATVTSGGACSSTPVETVRADAAVRVTAGSSPSNGPQVPSGSLNRNYPSGAGAASMTVFGYGKDPDGYVSSLVIDWGDGSNPTTVNADMSQCHDPETTWPASDGLTTGDQTHQYAAAGTYAVTLTVRSVGCGGGDAQSATVGASLATGGPPG